MRVEVDYDPEPLEGAEAYDASVVEIGEMELTKDGSDMPADLVVEEIVEGTGELATPGRTVTVHYTGWLRDEPGVTLVELDGRRAVVDLDPGADEQPLLRAALARGPVRAFAPVRPSLAEIFREVIQ